MNENAWATLTLTPTGYSEIPADDDRLEGLAAVVAGHPHVGGVETRDASTGLINEPSQVSAPDASENRPEQDLEPMKNDDLSAHRWSQAGSELSLVIYTTPDAVDSLVEHVKQTATGFGLEFGITIERHDGAQADAWRDEWKRHYQSQYFADRRLMLRPSWIAREAEDPKLEVCLDPGRAFGTGLHETTRLCLEAAARYCFARPRASADQPGANRVLDLGCGSGVLGIACLRILGPQLHADFVDVEADAVAATRENLAINDLEAALEGGDVQVTQGGVDEAPDGPYQLVLANIRPKVLIPGAQAISKRVGSGGHLLLSGILQEERDAVLQPYEALGMALEDEQQLGDWCSLLLRRGAR